jgi:hypothetical protein
MSAKQEQDAGREDDHKPVVEESPTEKLEKKQPGSDVPGAENPESEEVKKEINPNTE